MGKEKVGVWVGEFSLIYTNNVTVLAIVPQNEPYKRLMLKVLTSALIPLFSPELEL